MSLATVTPLPTSRPRTGKAQSKAPSRKVLRAQSRQRLAAVGLGAVAATLTGLSLSHLAHGISLVTHAPAWEGWAVAVGVDLGFVALELSQLAATEKARASVATLSKSVIMGTVAGSMVMNAAAFASQAEGYVMQGAAVAAGVAIPLLVYALTRIGATLYLDASKS